MKINKIRTIIYAIAKYLGDYKALKSGKIKQRLGVRITGFFLWSIKTSRPNLPRHSSDQGYKVRLMSPSS